MKSLKWLAVVLAGSVFLAACETSKAPKTRTSTSSSSTVSAPQVDLATVSLPRLSDTRGTDEKMVDFTTLNGDTVTYNQHTRKIVVIAGSQDLVAFGIQPLAYEGTSDTTGYESFYGDAQPLVNSTPFSTEEILSYEPELILVNQKMNKANIKALSKIAPVIPLYTDSTDAATRINYIGKIFGLEDHAKELIAYADSLKQAMLGEMNKLGIAGKTLTVYTYMGGISIPPERGWYMNTILYEDLGLKREAKVKEFMQDESGLAYETISTETLKEYEGDMVLFASFDSQDLSTYVTENVGWQSLKAVQEDRVGVVDITPYAQKGVLLLEKQYRQIYEALQVASR